MQGHFNPILSLHEHLKDDIASLNATILSCLGSSVPMVETIASHIVNAGGKRIRPLLTIAFARLFKPSGSIDEAIALAAAVELIHTATLIHDDVIDESTLRRNNPTANAIWGNKISVLVGDFLFSKAFQLMVKGDSLKIMGILAHASTRICEGEVKQLTLENDLNASVVDYRSVIELKTSSLFEAACVVGAMAVHVEDTEVQKVRDYGHYLGVVFQLIDDVLDYDVKANQLGKNPGDDFRDGKVTLPLILAKDHAANQQYVETWFETRRDEDFQSVVDFMYQHDILDHCRQLAGKDGDEAKQSIQHLPESHIQQSLIALIDHALQRVA